MLNWKGKLLLLSGNFRCDKDAAAAYHRDLVDPLNWELTTPSKALPVLTLLSSAGIFVDGLEKVAPRALSKLAPCMTSSELTALKRLPSFFSFSRGSQRHVAKNIQTPNAVIMDMYSTIFVGPPKLADTCIPPDPLDRSFIYSLNLLCSLMLLEMIAMSKIPSTWKDSLQEENLEVLLQHIRKLLAFSEVVAFKEVFWLLEVLRGDPKFFTISVDPKIGSDLFQVCIRKVHSLLPQLNSEQAVYVFLTIAQNKTYPHPFVVFSELEHIIVCSHPEDFLRIHTNALVSIFFFLASKRTIFENILAVLCNDNRFEEMTKTDCALLLSILGKASTDFPEFFSDLDWYFKERLLASFFAQVYYQATEMSLHECIIALEDIELLNTSSICPSAPIKLVEKVKRRVLHFLTVEQLPDKKNIQIPDLLNLIYRFEQLLRRCTVLPFTERDSVQIQTAVVFLRQVRESRMSSA